MANSRNRADGTGFVIAVFYLPILVAAMKNRCFVSQKNQVVEGPGGKQIQLLILDQNPIELFEPASRS